MQFDVERTVVMEMKRTKQMIVIGALMVDRAVCWPLKRLEKRKYMLPTNVAKYIPNTILVLGQVDPTC